ncbi:DEAD/DEAH box helicase [Marinicella rhabdoformis]|uniref:DEAD/DEAH box helicase n=1 Tax=Marinicella rhabdoformis TaxID=2580566 RepID=UPI0012AEC469
MKFTELGLIKPLLQAIDAQGYDTPSPVQEQAIPPVLAGKDVMAAAQTGTGKTAGFTLPILQLLSEGQPAQSNRARALVLTPTRELAAQVADSVATYGRNLNMKSAVVFGGVKINPQMMKLRRGVDVLVATPGRLLDLYGQKAVRFDDLEVLVLDEADRMLDMGFIHDIKKIIKLLPNKRQNLMFSATFSPEIRQLAKTITNDPVEITVSRNSTAASVKHWIHPVDKKRKSALLKHLINEKAWEQVLVFCRTKHGSNRLATFLEKNKINAAAIHGNKSQAARTKALAGFKNKKIQVLVATDIAARGIDIDQLPQVVNFDLPNVAEDYVHRIGRTGRAGSTGQAISLVSADEIKQLKDIEKLIKKKLDRELVDDYWPDHDLPDSPVPSKTTQPKRIKKPKPKGFVKASVKAKWAERQAEGGKERREHKPKNAKRAKPKNFVKASVKAKWAERSEEENQLAFARSQEAQQGQRGRNRAKSHAELQAQGNTKSADKKKGPWQKNKEGGSSEGRNAKPKGKKPGFKPRSSNSPYKGQGSNKRGGSKGGAGKAGQGRTQSKPNR